MSEESPPKGGEISALLDRFDNLLIDVAGTLVAIREAVHRGVRLVDKAMTKKADSG